MPICKPYHNTVRQFVDGEYSEGGRSRYIRHPSYAKGPSNYIRSFLLIQKDSRLCLTTSSQLTRISIRTPSGYTSYCTAVALKSKRTSRKSSEPILTLAGTT
jgi:hypothetical protein